MRRRDHVKKEENVSYWQSYSDMMAALLLIFVLVIAVAIVALNDYKEKLAEQNEELLARQDLLEKQADEYLKLKEELEEKQAEIDKIIGVKQEIIEALNQEFSKEEIAINIDQQTGAIVFDASILYDRSKSELKGEGIQFLDRFLPIYIGVSLRLLLKAIQTRIPAICIIWGSVRTGHYLLWSIVFLTAA